MKTQCPSQVSRYLFVSALLVALTNSGCVSGVKKMYEGPEVSPDKRAVIKRDRNSDGQISIFDVDNKKTYPLINICPEEVYVLPGKHNIGVAVSFWYGGAAANLWLVAEANETYVVKSKSKGEGVLIWIENERTGKPVGGIKGSSDEPK
jgi:hypothetical protein